VAVPTLVSRGVGAVLILLLAVKPQEELCLQAGNMRRIQWRMARNILHIGIPSAFENSLFQLGRVLVVSMIALFGTVHTSANAVANHLDGVGVIIGQAMSLAMVTVVGQCIGAGDHKQTIYYTKKLVLWDYILQGLSNVLILVFLDQLVGSYSSLSAQTELLAKQLVMVHASFAILLWPVGFVLPGALRAANDVRFTMVVSIFSMVMWRIGFSWILCVQLEWGAMGVWVAMIIDWIFRTIMFVGRMVSGKWKEKYVPT
jgi:Na+-driven multidrug efflux pump